MIPASTLGPLVERVESLVTGSTSRVIVGIAGMPGAGKSTLAEALVTALAGQADWRGTRVAYVPMDGFHLADAELRRLGLVDRKGAPATFDVAGYAALLARITAGETVWAPGFQRTLEEPIGQSLPIAASSGIVITEGNYLLVDRPEWIAVRRYLTETWYVVAEERTRLARLIARHVEFGKTPEEAREWVLRSDEANARLVATTASSADRVINID